MNSTNCTRAVEFILVGLPSVGRFENVMHAGIFLLYLLCLMGNGLIVMVILDRHLQKPMYFFLSNLSCIDIGHTTAFIPKLLVNYLSANNSICFYCCSITELFFYFFFGITEFFIIMLISVDRYLAICYSLRYTTIMTPGVCFKLAMAAWLVVLFYMIGQVVLIVNLPYCTSNIINHFFCDIGTVLKMAGGDTHLIEALGFLITVAMVMSSLFFTLISYLFIIFTILRMSSSTRQQRAFSTRASHLVVVCILYGSVFFVYLRPTIKNSSFGLLWSVSVVHTTVAPVLNPFVYTIRNNEMKEAIWKALRKKASSFLNLNLDLFEGAILFFKMRNR